jgi:hypothetical protein
MLTSPAEYYSDAFSIKKLSKGPRNDEAVEKLLVKETMQQLEESDEHTHIVQGEAE